MRRSPKTRPVLSRLRPTVDMALIPLCNTRFIKGHKLSNLIRARIKSHVYTTEWTVYHSTYHVKRHNKANTNVIYYINDKNVWYSGSEVQNTIKTLQSWAGRIEVLVVLVALSELPRVGRNWAAVEYPRGKVEKRQEWVHNLYSTSITQTMRL